jgi:hypothetical protein
VRYARVMRHDDGHRERRANSFAAVTGLMH